jgi:excisionase family DNA binding protein
MAKRSSPRPPPPQSRLYSLAEACVELGRSRATLYRHLGEKQVKTVVVGRSRKIPASEIERIKRDGLPPLPRRYKRLTDGKPPGRPRQKRRGQ